MTRRDDRSPDMVSGTEVDAAIDRALHGATVGDILAPFAGFVDDLRVMADTPPPPPSAELAAMLRDTADKAASAASASGRPAQLTSRRSRAAGVRLRVAAMGLVGKAAVCLALAGTVAASEAAGILPEPVSHFVRRAIEVVTPFELPHHAAEHPGHDGHTAANARVASGDVEGEDALPHTAPPSAATARAVPMIDVRSDDIDAAAATDAPTLAGPPARASSEAGHEKKVTSPAQGPEPASPPSTPPKGSPPVQGPPPHAGPAARPDTGPAASPKIGSNADDGPPGPHPSASLPHGPHTLGPGPQDPGHVEDRPPQSGPNGPQSGPGTPASPPAADGDPGPVAGPAPG